MREERSNGDDFSDLEDFIVSGDFPLDETSDGNGSPLQESFSQTVENLDNDEDLLEYDLEESSESGLDESPSFKLRRL